MLAAFAEETHNFEAAGVHGCLVGPCRFPLSHHHRLLRAYLSYVRGTTPQLDEVRLLCKENLVSVHVQPSSACGPVCAVEFVRRSHVCLPFVDHLRQTASHARAHPQMRNTLFMSLTVHLLIPNLLRPTHVGSCLFSGAKPGMHHPHLHHHTSITTPNAGCRCHCMLVWASSCWGPPLWCTARMCG